MEQKQKFAPEDAVLLVTPTNQQDKMVFNFHAISIFRSCQYCACKICWKGIDKTKNKVNCHAEGTDLLR